MIIMIIQSLQTILHLIKKYLSDELPCIQYPILNISYTHEVSVCKACISSFYFILLDGGSLEDILTVPLRVSQKSCQISVSLSVSIMSENIR